MDLRNSSKRLSSAAFLLLAAAAPAAAADSGAPASKEATVTHPNHSANSAKPDADEPKKICRNIAQTHSRLLTRRVCLTREQWRNAKYN
jgi:hypothetical protein